MKRHRQPRTDLSSNEWDFRGVTEPELRCAIFYEYARSSERLKKAILCWHAKKFNVPKTACDGGEWNGLTVGDALAKLRRDSLSDPPAEPPALEVLERIFENQPDEISDFGLLHATFGFYPEFPPPPFLLIRERRALVAQFHEKYAPPPAFICLPERSPREKARLKDSGLSKDEMRRLQMKNSLADWHGIDWAQPGWVAAMHQLGVRKYVIVLNHRYGNKRLKAELSRWLDRLPGKQIKNTLAKRGRGAVAPWHELKELAAYRLEQAGYNYQSARALIEKHRKRTPQVSQDVLPLYGSGAWTDATANAEARLEVFPAL